MKINIKLSQEELVAIYAALKNVESQVMSSGNSPVTQYVFGDGDKNDGYDLDDLIQKIYSEVSGENEYIIDEIDEMLDE